MINALMANVLMLTFIVQGSEQLEFSFGPHGSSHILYLDNENDYSQWQFGGEVGIFNIIPHIGIKIRASKLRFTGMPHNMFYDVDAFEYIPLSLCGSFDLLPFFEIKELRFTLETGLSVIFWQGMSGDNVYILSDGTEMKERDIGFIGGATLQLRPHKNFAVEGITRYTYIASTDLNKYGYFDKDEKIWENGVGVKLIIPKW